jgi:ABC-type branched-subunit amino acid transport system substrate-binding protein
MRTCTPDDKQAKAMIKIIQSLKSNYIQIVYSEGTYGEGGRDAIRREARLGNICIKKEIVVKEGESYTGILSQLRVSYFAKIVIVFLRSHVVDPVTTAINENMDYGEFMFIGSEHTYR